jgi:putative phosphoesterase
MVRFMPYQRVAVISDVHGNVPALSAVLDAIEESNVDLVVSCGDLTWGAEPSRTASLVAGLGERVILVRGNACRALLELAHGERGPGRGIDAWMLEHHSPEAVALLERSVFSTVLELETLGPVRFCHGSPRKDTETVTPGTPEARLRALTATITEKVLVTGHTHLQFDREVGGIRSINAGSVGLPYHLGEPGTAYWATLGADGVRLRRTRFDLEAAVRAYHDSGHPMADRLEEMLTRPPAPDEIVAHAESLVFSD